MRRHLGTGTLALWIGLGLATPAPADSIVGRVTLANGDPVNAVEEPLALVAELDAPRVDHRAHVAAFAMPVVGSFRHRAASPSRRPARYPGSHQTNGF